MSASHDPPESGGLSPTNELKTLKAIRADKTLSPMRRLVLAAIVGRANHKTGEAWTSYESLMAEIGCKRHTVYDAIRAGRGKYIQLAGRGRGGAGRYRVLVPGAEINSAPQRTIDDADSAPTRTIDDDGDEGAKRSIVRPETHNSAPTRTHTNVSSSASRKNRRASATADPRIKTFIQWFADEYRKALGREYIISWRTESGIVKALLGKVGKAAGVPDELPELQRAARTMFADDFWRPKAGIKTLQGKINEFRADAPAKTGYKPAPGYAKAKHDGQRLVEERQRETAAQAAGKG